MRWLREFFAGLRGEPSPRANSMEAREETGNSTEELSQQPTAPAKPQSAPPRPQPEPASTHSDAPKNRPPLVPLEYAVAQTDIDVDSLRDAKEASALNISMTNVGNLEMAIQLARRAVMLSPEPDTVFNLAISYRLAGQFTAARQLNELLLHFNPHDMDAMAELDACKDGEFDGSPEYDAARTRFIKIWKSTVPEGEAEEKSKGAFNTLAHAGPDAATMMYELWKIGASTGFLNHSTPRPAAFNDRGRHARAYEIGELLNQMGGFSLMQQIGEAVNKMPVPRGLEQCWGGIGSWRS